MRKVPVELIIPISIAALIGVALYFRVYFPYDRVFSSEWVKFTSVDAYYHMRIVDNLVHNFPHLYTFDPYFLYPGGGWLTRIHFFDWLLAGIIWVVSLGSPTQHTIDVIGVYYPAVLATMTVIPVYFIGRALFNRWAGVLAAALIAIMPGEFIGRSILGFTDNPAAEVLFTSVTMLFLLLAVKAARQKRLSFNHIKHRDWAVVARPLVYALLTGISLGIYLISWAGGLLFVFLISVYLIVQFIIDHVRHRSTDYLGIIGVVLFLIALLIFAPSSPSMLHPVSLIIALLIPLVLSGISWLMAGKKIKPAYYPLALIGIGLAGVAIIYFVNPSLLKTMLSQFSIFAPTGTTALTTLEMQPLLSPYGSLTISAVWGNFTTGFFFSFITLGVLIYLVIKQGSAERTLLLVWSVVILAAALGQRRFAYYLAVNVAVLTGYFAWQFLQFIALLTDWLFGQIGSIEFKKRMVRSVEMPQAVAREKAGPEKKPREETYAIKYIFVALAVIIVFFSVYFWNIPKAVSVGQGARFAPSDGWQNALSWMRENTPDPFADSEFYYEFYEPPPPGERYDYPESAYGVTAWWDYGYWITRIARRLPNTNPGQSPGPITDTANLFLSTGESPGEEIIQKLGSSYVVLDHMTTGSKFWAIASWAGREPTEFMDVYYLPYENALMPVRFYLPAYYRAMCTRLYNFDGKAVIPQNPIVISYEERISAEGNPYKHITGAQDFSSYEEALDYIESKGSANNKIVGTNPFVSPVPLEALGDYKLVYGSDSEITNSEVGAVPEVKIFEYIK